MQKPAIGLILAGSAQELLWICVRSLGPLREHTAAFLCLIFLIFITCIAAYFHLPIRCKREIRLLLFFAALFRITLIPAPPSQSEDVYRYLWDARVSSAGISPYAHPPAAVELAGFRDKAVYPMINSKSYITAYPPLSQILFRANFELFGGKAAAMKAMFGLLEFMAVIVAWRLLVLWDLSVQPLVLMAWNPLFIFEFSHSGHSDSAMVFLMLLSVYLLSLSRNAWAMASYAGAVLAKLHPALWFPLYWRRTGWKPALAGLAVGAGLSAVYFTMESGLRYLQSLGLYFRLFEFNASIHYLIRIIGRVVFHESWDKAIGPYLAAALLVTAAIILWRWRVRDGRDLLHAGFWLMTADLCLATTVHPWYLSWAALALPFFPYAFMVYWTGACFLSYAAYAFHPVYEPGWVLLLEYIPVYGLMAWELRRRRPMMEAWRHGEKPAGPGGGSHQDASPAHDAS